MFEAFTKCWKVLLTHTLEVEVALTNLGIRQPPWGNSRMAVYNAI